MKTITISMDLAYKVYQILAQDVREQLDRDILETLKGGDPTKCLCYRHTYALEALTELDEELKEVVDLDSVVSPAEQLLSLLSDGLRDKEIQLEKMSKQQKVEQEADALLAALPDDQEWQA